jgi:diguanylate cyclase (GGDEF)-like protein
MYEVMADAEGVRVPQRRLALWSVLLVAATIAFVTSLIVFSRAPSPSWLLYLVPIIIGALAYDVAGGIVVTALSLGALVLAAPLPMLKGSWDDIATGFAVFLGCAVVIGIQARRQRSHGTALEQASALDPLTGVLKAEHFTGRLAEEVRRANRYNHDVGVVLVRVEGFAEFVQLFGHYKAESMLQHLSEVVRLAVRDTDVVGRLETTTFAIVLPSAGAAHAALAADRLLQATLRAEFEGDALEPVTTCIAITAAASYPEEAPVQSELLELAHRRLEAASTGLPRSKAPAAVEGIS